MNEKQASEHSTVSVVIPTAGARAEQLKIAVASVYNQSYLGKIEILIIDDSREGINFPCEQYSAQNRECRIVVNDRSKTSARQAGTDAASGVWTAYLDDDDEWLVEKVEKQLELAEDSLNSRRFDVISCRIRHRYLSIDRLSDPVPYRLIGGEGIASYLFRRRPPTVGRPSLFTSTLLVRTELAKRVPWVAIPRHQDWDWLLRADVNEGASFAHHENALAIIAVGSANSISATIDWRSSLIWSKKLLRSVDRPAFVDFLSSQSLRYALQSRSLSGVIEIVREIARVGTFPSFPAIATGLAGIVPRSVLEKVMAMRAR